MSGRLVGLGTFATKGAADKALALALADQTRGGWVDPARGRVTLADYANSWLEDRRLRPRTQELYEGLVRLHIVPALGELELGKLTPSIIRRWHSRMIDVQSVGESRRPRPIGYSTPFSTPPPWMSCSPATLAWSKAQAPSMLPSGP
jgi:hypothetical protein